MNGNLTKQKAFFAFTVVVERLLVPTIFNKEIEVISCPW
jgi:hypothetical protein